jgi:hypothetical protein
MSKIADKIKESRNNIIASSVASIVSKKLEKFLKEIPKTNVLNDMVVIAEPTGGKTNIHLVEFQKDDNGTVSILRVVKSYDLSELAKQLLQVINNAGVDTNNLFTELNEDINQEKIH